MRELELRNYLSLKKKILHKLLKEGSLSRNERNNAEIVISYLNFSIENIDFELGIFNKYFYGSLHKSDKDKKSRSAQDSR